MDPATQRERLLQMAARPGFLTTRQVTEAGLHRQMLSRLVQEGSLERLHRGRYRLVSEPATEHHGLALVANAVPHAVVCLLSALSFHQIGTQIPFQAWIAIDRRARKPDMAFPPLRVVRFSGQALQEGVEVHRIEGQPVKIYGVAKTVADCFKYRHKIGLEIALEALREAWRQRRFQMEELSHFARICRVERVMQPYLEALLA